MNKQLSVFGMVILILVVGLSGCNQLSNGDTVSFQELNDHLAKYIGKNITIVGYIGEVIGKEWSNPYTANFYDSSSSPSYAVGLQVPSDIDVYRGQYRIRGTVKEAGYIITYIALVDVVSAEPI